MASQPVPPFICVVHVYRADVRPSTWHLFFLSSLASSHCRPYEAQNSPQVFGTMSSKSITAEQSENAVQILPFLTSSQPSGSHGVVLDVGAADGAGVGLGVGEGIGDGVGSGGVGDGVGAGVGAEVGAVIGAGVGDGVGSDVTGAAFGIGIGLGVGAGVGGGVGLGGSEQ